MLWQLRAVRVWVSGARGFVGSWLVPHLARAGHEVVAAGRELDVGDAPAVGAAIEAARPDAIVHLAARASVAASLDDSEATARVNYGGALAVLRAAVRCVPQARVVLVGSGEIYGGTLEPKPLDETTPLAPDSPYARSKAAADLAGAAFAARGLASLAPSPLAARASRGLASLAPSPLAARASRGLDVVRARPFSHTGAGQRDDYVAASFARQIAEIEAGRREPVLRVGNLDAVRDLLDVGDVVEAYRRLLDRSVAPGAYNVASGVGRSIRELLDVLLGHARVRPRIEVDAARWRPTRASVGDATRLRRATGWTRQVPFETTLARLLDDWRRRVSETP